VSASRCIFTLALTIHPSSPKSARRRRHFVGSFSFFPEVWGVELLNTDVKRANGEELLAQISPTPQLFLSSANFA
jgi:hypothetical protein